MKEVCATLFRHGLRGLHGFFLFFICTIRVIYTLKKYLFAVKQRIAE